MSKTVQIIRETLVFQKYIFKIYEVLLRHSRYDGTLSEPLTRLHLERGAGAAAVVHDRDAGAILLVEQFRHPTHYAGGPGWLLELPAGIVEQGEDPKTTVRREIVEEIGYTATELEHIHTFYVSPGGTTERIYLYYALVSGGQEAGSGGGLEAEGEDIRRVSLPVADIAARIAEGTIQDARTLIGLQWFLLNKSALSS